MRNVYGEFPDRKLAKSWVPPPAIGGHRGRYLWTDGFGVVNFISLVRLTADTYYLTLAERLIERVHDVLGRTRDGSRRLPGATDEEPLKGGLRIGKIKETGPDGDGQYFHYLTVWMFALNRMWLISEELKYNDLAIQLARAVHPAFVVDRDSTRPRMYWKMSMDLSRPLVRSEGNLDPIDGYVVYSRLQRSGLGNDLQEEVADYKKIVEAKWRHYGSCDPLDLGMTLWTTHWLVDDPREEWAAGLTRRALGDLRDVVVSRYFDAPLSSRLAFREFGTALGIRCHSGEEDLQELAKKITKTWENEILEDYDPEDELGPITSVMYVAAAFPGAFMNGFMGDEDL
ncbi:hypothetical protein OE88DRAFT_453149 [Heliocybe sulcata]|uniref:Six-hairpin glycosidase n=1 Tax=Heliocybe sulcata TaxID=5364 RepID=A0A5C3MUL5_9AGAM|nr:hypothetical protein OE88DRAFT_453149 [Heliocybe sulcata]